MKDIPGFEGRYAVTRDGKVWSYPRIAMIKNGKRYGVIKDGHWIKEFDHYKGYGQYFLSCGKRGSRKTISTHQIVARTYIPNPKGLKEINHKNSIKRDNRVENLEWCTRLENMHHAYDQGLIPPSPCGEKHANAKLTWKQVREIRKNYIKGVTPQRAIAKLYGVDQRLIWAIVNGKLWKESSSPSCINSLEGQV